MGRERAWLKSSRQRIEVSLSQSESQKLSIAKHHLLVFSLVATFANESWNILKSQRTCLSILKTSGTSWILRLTVSLLFISTFHALFNSLQHDCCLIFQYRKLCKLKHEVRDSSVGICHRTWVLANWFPGAVTAPLCPQARQCDPGMRRHRLITICPGPPALHSK